MAVIKAGRTRLIKAGFVGAGIALIPAIIVCAVLVFFIAKKDTKLEEVNMELGRYKEGTVCILKKDMERGQEIRAEDVSVVSGKFYNRTSFDKPEDYIGMVLRTDIRSGTILNTCVVAEKENVGDNLRTYYIDYMDIPAGFSDGTSFDIRICFPNGEDYLVAGNKEISVRDEEGFYVDLTRREALLLSSARVDSSIYTGTRLYAAFYTTGFEMNEIQTYPVNSYVFSLGQWEPNIKETFSEEMYLKRETLEKNLLEFMGVSNNIQ